jgi:hypothetical protein
MKKIVLLSKKIDGVIYDLVVNELDRDSFRTGAVTIDQAVTVRAWVPEPQK